MKLNRLAIALSGIGLLTLTQQGFAQEAVKKEEEKKAEVQKVVVTGSSIKRINLETASPVQVISRDEMVRGGATSLSDVLKNVSSNVGGVDENRTGGFTAGAQGLNLRSMGSQATLVLINGRRLAPYAQPDYQTTFVDLNSVPVGAVERIEILKDGASAIYGSEAIAGVVNIIMRESYEGADVSASFSQSQKRDGEQTRFTGSYGFGSLAENKFNFYATLDVRQAKPTLIKNRDEYMSTQDLRAWGYRDGRSLYTAPGNLYWTDKASGKIVTRNLGNTCPENRLVPATNLFGAGAMGNACVHDDFQDSTYNSTAKSDRIGLVSRGTWQLNSDTTAFAEVMVNQVKASIQGLPNWFLGRNGEQTPALALNHPQYPKDLIDPVTGKTLAGGNGSVRIAASLTDLPGQGLDNTVLFGRYLAGLKGSYKTWDWESAVMYNSSTVDSRGTSGLLATPLINAYQKGELVFGQIGANSALVNKLMGNYVNKFKSEMMLWDGKMSGEIMQLPAGPMTAAIGAELRRETLKSDPDALAVAGEIYHRAQSEPGYTRSRNIKSLYSELSIPLLKDVEASLALRHDRYSDYGNSTTPKLGLKWNVTPDFLLRGTYSKGFRAPTLVENSTSSKNAFYTYEDPARCNEKFRVGCQWSSAYISGSNPELKPETAKSFTLGLAWEPTKWFDATVDFWQITRDNEISTFDVKTVLSNPTRYAGNPAVSIVRDPLTDADKAAGATAGEITLLKMLLTNVAQTKAQGVDVQLRGRFNLGEYGQLKPILNASFINSFKSTPSPDAEMIEYAGSRSLPRLKANLGLGWEKAAWKLSVDTDYIGHFSAIGDFTQPCEFKNQGYEALCRDIPSFTTVNFGGSYSGLYKDLKISFAIRNFFDRKPPFAPDPSSAQALAVHPFHDRMGRYFQLTVDYKFK